MSCSMSSVSDIKLIRTDTTLDLSQKAEKRCPKWPTPVRVLHCSCTEDMVVLLQTRLPCPECQPASATTQQQAFLSDGSGHCSLCCSTASKQLHTQPSLSIPLIREQIFVMISLSTTIPQGKHRFSSDHRS